MSVIFLYIKKKAYIIITRYYSSAVLSLCEQTGLNAAVSVAYFSSDSLSSVTQAQTQVGHGVHIWTPGSVFLILCAHDKPKQESS